MAIDAYVAGADLDAGEAWGESVDNLSRALMLARSLKDEARASAVARAMLDYVDRTADDHKVGTYVYAFDELVAPKKALGASPRQAGSILDRLERCVAKLAADNSASPYVVNEVGKRLVAHYRKANSTEEVQRVLKIVAGAFEARALGGSALAGPPPP